MLLVPLCVGDGICIVQVQPRKYVLGGTDYTTPTRQQLNPTDQQYVCLKDLGHEVGIGDVSKARNVVARCC